ncbi:hypothetical protein [Nonomuraea cavernae]|uniref:hypothetical protein n=1 Tax=Nonomuraea cavernae TaxID=2045107 RepID=UPI0034067852
MDDLLDEAVHEDVHVQHALGVQAVRLRSASCGARGRRAGQGASVESVRRAADGITLD